MLLIRTVFIQNKLLHLQSSDWIHRDSMDAYFN